MVFVVLFLDCSDCARYHLPSFSYLYILSIFFFFLACKVYIDYVALLRTIVGSEHPCVEACLLRVFSGNQFNSNW